MYIYIYDKGLTSNLHKIIYRFKAIPTKIAIGLIPEIKKIIQKFIWNHKQPKQS